MQFVRFHATIGEKYIITRKGLEKMKIYDEITNQQVLTLGGKFSFKFNNPICHPLALRTPHWSRGTPVKATIYHIRGSISICDYLVILPVTISIQQFCGAICLFFSNINSPCGAYFVYLQTWTHLVGHCYCMFNCNDQFQIYSFHSYVYKPALHPMWINSYAS